MYMPTMQPETRTEQYCRRHYKLLSYFQATNNPRCSGFQLFESNVNEQQEVTLMSLLHYACEFGNQEEVEELLEAGANIFLKDSNGNLPLHYLATCTDNVEIFKLIYAKAEDDFEKKKLIESENKNGYSLIRCAIENRRQRIVDYLENLYRKFEIGLDDDCVKLLETKGITLSFMKSQPELWSLAETLLQAVESNNIELVQKLLAQCQIPRILQGSSMDKGAFSFRYLWRVNSYGYDALRIAISQDNVEILKLLLPPFHGNLNMSFNGLENIFFVAVKHNSVESVRYLLNAADIRVNENSNKTIMEMCRTKLLFESDARLCMPIHQVAKTGNTAIFKIINEFYEDINIRNADLQTPMHIAAANKNLEIFQLIFKRSDYSLYLNDKNGETPFFIISKNNIAQLLEFVTKNLKLYKDPERRKYFLDVAIKSRSIWLLKYVFENNAVVFTKFSVKRTCALMHLDESSTEAAEICQSYKQQEKKLKCDINQDNQTYLKLAIKEGFVDGVFYLLKRHDWDKLFRQQYPSSRNPTRENPVNLLIQYMPDMAKILFDQCIVKQQDKTFFNYGLIDNVFYKFDDETFSNFIQKFLQNEKTEILPDYQTNSEENIKLLPITGPSDLLPYIHELYSNEQNEEIEAFTLDEPAEPKDEPFSQTVKTHPLTVTVKCKGFALLNHPYAESLIDLKWNRFAKWGYYSLCLYYLFIAVALAFLIIATTTKNGFSNDGPEINNSFLNVTTAEKDEKILKVDYLWEHYYIYFPTSPWIFICPIYVFKDFVLMQRWFDVITLFLTSFATLPVCFFTPFKFQWSIIVLLTFCASVTLINYIKRHPIFGVSVVMMIQTLIRFLRFAPVFFIFILPFAVLFYVLLNDKTGVFPFFDTYIHTLVMMIGEFDYSNLISTKQSFVISTIFCLFLFGISIFLNNLFIGLTVSDTAEAKIEAALTQKILQIETIHHVEMIMPEWIRKKYWDGFCKQPKEISEIEKATHRFTSPVLRELFQWWGMSKEAAKRMDITDPVEEKIDALKQEVNQIKNDLNEKMNDIIELLKRR